MAQEEEVLGKAYDARLTRRLLTYLRPYRWQTITALTAIILKSGADVVGPYITKTAIDKYLSPPSAVNEAHHVHIFDYLHLHLPFSGWLSSNPFVGIGQLTAVYVSLQIAIFFFEFVQTYYMQWCGQKVMYDLRSTIFRHLQRMHAGFY